MGNNDPALYILDDVIDACLDEWKFNLIGRLDVVKLKIEIAESALRKQWNISGAQVLHIRVLGEKIIPENKKSSRAFVWAHFPRLSIEYLNEPVVMSIGRAIGRLVKVD